MEKRTRKDVAELTQIFLNIFSLSRKISQNNAIATNVRYDGLSIPQIIIFLLAYYSLRGNIKINEISLNGK